jgi:hypothetical protein
MSFGIREVLAHRRENRMKSLSNGNVISIVADPEKAPWAMTDAELSLYIKQRSDEHVRLEKKVRDLGNRLADALIEQGNRRNWRE